MGCHWVPVPLVPEHVRLQKMNVLELQTTMSTLDLTIRPTTMDGLVNEDNVDGEDDDNDGQLDEDWAGGNSEPETLFIQDLTEMNDDDNNLASDFKMTFHGTLSNLFSIHEDIVQVVKLQITNNSSIMAIKG